MGGGARQGVKISEIGAQILKIGAREMFFWGKPVGIQSGSTRDAVGHQCREAAKFIENRVLARFWMILAASRQVQKWCQKLQNWCLTASRKNALPHHLRPYFPLRPTLAPIFLCPYFPFPRTSHAPTPPPPAPKRQKQSWAKRGLYVCPGFGVAFHGGTRLVDWRLAQPPLLKNHMNYILAQYVIYHGFRIV